VPYTVSPRTAKVGVDNEHEIRELLKRITA